MDKKAAKKFGKSRAVAGTGKVDANSVDQGDSWVAAISEQTKAMQSSHKRTSKYLPINLIKPDPHNPRELDVSGELVQRITQTHPLKAEWLDDDQDVEWKDAYVEAVASHYHLSGKALVDFISILDFAVSLKTCDRLIQPVAVIRVDESQFILLVGERRWLAHLLLVQATILSSIWEGEISREDIDRLQWEENESTESMNLYERLTSIKRIKGHYEKTHGDISVRKLAAIIGKGRTVAHNYLHVCNCKHEGLLEAIQQGKITELKKAAKLAQLNKRELTAALEGSPKKPAAAPLFKLSKKTDVDALGLVLNAAAKELDLGALVKTPVDSLERASEVLDGLVKAMSQS